MKGPWGKEGRRFNRPFHKKVQRCVQNQKLPAWFLGKRKRTKGPGKIASKTVGMFHTDTIALVRSIHRTTGRDPQHMHETSPRDEARALIYPRDRAYASALNGLHTLVID